MKLVLLERVENLGAMGDVVTVRPGFARGDCCSRFGVGGPSRNPTHGWL